MICLTTKLRHGGYRHALLKLVKEHPSISEREKNVVILRFGLDDDHERTLQEIGNIYKVTRERIRQIEAKAVRKLRHHPPALSPSASSGTGGKSLCPKCKTKGYPRSGADFAGQMLCPNCRHIWRWVASNGYGHLP